MQSRRAFLAATAGLAATPGLSFARTPGEKRFVLIILRGGMDGLAAAPAIGDPDFLVERGVLAVGRAEGALPLDGRYALHPAMPEAYDLYRAGELAVVHAIAPPYRARSHFDAQNVLENGGVAAFERKDGWLNRALQAMGGDAPREAIAIANQMPHVLRGDADATSWAPRRAAHLSEPLLDRVRAMYANDPVLGPALDQGLAASAMAAAAMSEDGDMRRIGARRALALAANAELAAGFLARADGPRLAVIEGGQWDTHVGQGQETGRIARLVADLSRAFANLKSGLGPAWRDTVVVAVTEFGRTVRPNGAGGSDHGVGGAAFVAGGAVKGGQTIADWPGLAPAALLEGRDLAPTIDMRSLFKTVLGEHLRIADAQLDRAVFPDSAGVRTLQTEIIRG